MPCAFHWKPLGLFDAHRKGNKTISNEKGGKESLNLVACIDAQLFSFPDV